MTVLYREICKISKSSHKEQVIRVSRNNILEDLSLNISLIPLVML